MRIIWVNIFTFEGQFKLGSNAPCCTSDVIIPDDHEGIGSSDFALLPAINSPKYTPF